MPFRMPFEAHLQVDPKTDLLGWPSLVLVGRTLDPALLARTPLSELQLEEILVVVAATLAQIGSLLHSAP